MNESPAAESALAAIEAQQRRWGFRRFRTWTVVVAVVAFYIVSWRLAQVDPAKLVTNLLKLGHWIATRHDHLRWRVAAFPAAHGWKRWRWPPSAPRWRRCCSRSDGGARQPEHYPIPGVYAHPARWFLRPRCAASIRFVFRIAIRCGGGSGSCARVSSAWHCIPWGSAAKFFADHIGRARQLGPLHAVETTGAGRLTAIAYALVPDVAPVMLSTTLFWWEFNVRASTVLGVVGAGGIGQELKNSMDLLDFARLFTIIAEDDSDRRHRARPVERLAAAGSSYERAGRSADVRRGGGRAYSRPTMGNRRSKALASRCMPVNLSRCWGRAGRARRLCSGA